jgi:hypothetical protein
MVQDQCSMPHQPIRRHVNSFNASCVCGDEIYHLDRQGIDVNVTVYSNSLDTQLLCRADNAACNFTSVLSILNTFHEPWYENIPIRY